MTTFSLCTKLNPNQIVTLKFKPILLNRTSVWGSITKEILWKKYLGTSLLNTKFQQLTLSEN